LLALDGACERGQARGPRVMGEYGLGVLLRLFNLEAGA